MIDKNEKVWQGIQFSELETGMGVYRGSMKSLLSKLTRMEAAADSWKPAVLIFMVSFYPLAVIPGIKTGYTMPKYVLLAVAAAITLCQIIYGRVKIEYHPALIFLALFALCALISTILAPNQLTAWFGLYRYTGFCTYLYCMVLFLLAADFNKPLRIISWMAVTAAVISLIALLQYLGLNFIPHQTHEALHAYATIGNRNFVGSYTVFILPAATCLYLQQRRKALWLVSSALIYGGLLVTLTRGAWIALPLPLLILFCHFWREPQNRKHILILCIVLLLVTCLLAPLHDWMLIKRALSIKAQITLALELDDTAGTWRLYIWKEALKLIPAHWAFGIGPDSLVIPLGPNYNADKVHNIYIEIAVTMGLFAFIAYMTFLSFFLRRWNNETGFLLFLMISTYLIQGFFNIDVVGVMPLFWITLGLSLANIKASTAAPVQQGSPCRLH